MEYAPSLRNNIFTTWKVFATNKLFRGSSWYLSALRHLCVPAIPYVLSCVNAVFVLWQMLIIKRSNIPRIDSIISQVAPVCIDVCMSVSAFWNKDWTSHFPDTLVQFALMIFEQFTQCVVSFQKIIYRTNVLFFLTIHVVFLSIKRKWWFQTWHHTTKYLLTCFSNFAVIHICGLDQNQTYWNHINNSQHSVRQWWVPIKKWTQSIDEQYQRFNEIFVPVSIGNKKGK